MISNPLALILYLAAAHVAYSLPVEPSPVESGPLTWNNRDIRTQCGRNRPLRPSLSSDQGQCAKALQGGFPLDSENAHFHHAGDDDEWRLPRTATHGNCQIKVDLSDEGRNLEYMSWTAIRILAQELILVCTYHTAGPPFTAKTGGMMSKHWGLKIRITQPELRLGNESLALIEPDSMGNESSVLTG